MSDDASRYSVSAEGNVEMQFVDEEQMVLVNKGDITNLEALQRAEEEGLARAYEVLLSEVRIDTLLTCELLRHVHHRIFGDLYEWSGKWRTVNISKPGVQWPPPNYLNETMHSFEKEVLVRYPYEKLVHNNDFCSAAGHIQGEFLAIHPFSTIRVIQGNRATSMR